MGGVVDLIAPGATATMDIVAPDVEIPGTFMNDTAANISTGGLSNALGITTDDSPITKILGAPDPLYNTYQGIEKMNDGGNVYDAADRAMDPGWDDKGFIDTVIRDLSEELPQGVKDVAQVALPIIGGAVAGTYIPVLGAPAGAAIGAGLAGKIAGGTNEQNIQNAAQTYVTASALQGLANDYTNPGDALGGGFTDPDMYEAAMQLDKGINLEGGIESGLGFSTAAPIGAASPTILDGVIAGVTNPANAPEIVQIAATVAQLASGPPVGGPEFPPLPAVLEPAEPGPPLPDLPKKLGGALPEGVTWPEVEPYLPKNWDSMSEAEKETWLVTRGAEIKSRRRGTWAGNLEGIRGGKGPGLEYAELVAENRGKSILGE